MDKPEKRCPVCGEKLYRDGKMVYCKTCGFEMLRKPKKQRRSEDK
jgi:ribosomal protein L37E